MKKIGLCSMILALILSFALSGFVLAAEKNLKVAMILWRGETIAEKGFKDGLKELGYSVQYAVLNADQDRNELARLLRINLRPRLHQFDYVYTFGTTVSRVTKIAINSKVPQIFNVVAAPVQAGLVQGLEESGGNIGGVTNGISLDLQIKTARKIIKFKKLGFIFNQREKNSLIIRKMLYKISAQLNFKVIEFKVFKSKNMLREQLRKIVDKEISVDAVYLPLDSFVVSNAKLIGSVLRKAKIKSVGAIKSYIEHGALMGIVPDYYNLGKAAASILHQHRNGKKLQGMPIYTPKNPKLVINKSTSILLKVKIPKDILKRSIFID